ncbi:sialin-like isoform X2 [Adelges cooleyi]|uniref:sialin-like isoform X2 n=1 Tax=Adelges cooleyi TaxID=133065 RepID=UPI00217FBC75|nr:sialin-like isoform X2 [Adelges cooleyi]
MLDQKYFPQRWVMAAMATLGLTMTMLMRASLSVTITQMVLATVNNVQSAADKGKSIYCPVPPSVKLGDGNTTTVVENYGDRFDWDQPTQGMVLSAFFYGYIITHIPGSILAQKYGGKYIMGLGVLCSSVLTLLTPFVAHFGPTPLMALRFVEGLGEGSTFPALCTLLARWAPPLEKGRLSTIVFSGAQIGNILAILLSGMIIVYVPGGWPNVFYIYGSCSIIWFCVWCMVVYDDPESHPFISEEEREYLKQSIGNVEKIEDLAPTPWKRILTSWPVWALIVIECGHDWAFYTIMTDLPKYQNDVLHFSIKQNALLSSIPFMAQWITSISSSILCDWLLKKNYMSVTAVRKTFAAVGNILPAYGVMAASFVGCDTVATTLFFTLGMSMMGFSCSSIRINALDLSPNYSASIMALVNGIGSMTGMISPYVTGVLTTQRTVLEWRLVFWIMLIIMMTSTITFIIFGSAKLQPWNDSYNNLGNNLDNKLKTFGKMNNAQITD